MLITNCHPGRLTIEGAPQHELDKILSGVKGRDIHIIRSVANKPEPLPTHEMDFPPLAKVASGEDQDGRVRVHNVPRGNDGSSATKPEPLPIPAWDFAPLTKVS